MGNCLNRVVWYLKRFLTFKWNCGGGKWALQWWIVSTDLSDIWKEFWLPNEIVEEVSEGSPDPLNQNLRHSPEKITLPMGFNIKGKLYWRFNKTTLTFSFNFSLIWIGHFEELHLEIMFGEIFPNLRPTFWGNFPKSLFLTNGHFQHFQSSLCRYFTKFNTTAWYRSYYTIVPLTPKRRSFPKSHALLDWLIRTLEKMLHTCVYIISNY